MKTEQKPMKTEQLPPDLPPVFGCETFLYTKDQLVQLVKLYVANGRNPLAALDVAVPMVFGEAQWRGVLTLLERIVRVDQDQSQSGAEDCCWIRQALNG